MYKIIASGDIKDIKFLARRSRVRALEIFELCKNLKRGKWVELNIPSTKIHLPRQMLYRLIKTGEIPKGYAIRTNSDKKVILVHYLNSPAIEKKIV